MSEELLVDAVSNHFVSNPKLLDYDSYILIGGHIDEFYSRFPELDGRDNVVLINPINYNYKANITHFSHEVLYDEYVVLLLAYFLIDKKQESLSSIDVGYLSSEANFAEEELEAIVRIVRNTRPLFIVGKDFYNSLRSENIFRIINLIASEYHVSLLEDKNVSIKKGIDKAQEIHGDLDGLVLYLKDCNSETIKLEISNQFALVGKIQDSDLVKVRFGDKEFIANVFVDKNLKGLIGMLYIQDNHFDFCYCKADIKKVS